MPVTVDKIISTSKVKLTDSVNSLITVQNPLPVDGDSVYAKDIDLTTSTKVGWTGNIVDLFDCPNSSTGLYNNTSTSPKILYIAFCRTLYLNAIGLGCNLTGKTFSNVKIEFIGSDGTVRSTYDDSSNNTKYGTRLYSFAPTACIALKFSFVTTNTDVGLSNITIQKEVAVVARLRALKPDGTVTDIDATTGGNMKVSVEEFDDAVGGILGLVPNAYDYISLSYTGENLTGVVFKSGGSGGTTVATLTLGYDANDNLTSVTKT